MENLVELHIKDFRAIASADIILNGITVVSGINGAGKSTMSKLLYDVFKYANSFEELALQEANNELLPRMSVLLQMYSYSTRTFHEGLSSAFRKYVYNSNTLSSFDDLPSFLATVKQICKVFLEALSDKEGGHKVNLTPRFRRILGLNASDGMQEIQAAVDDIKRQIQDIVVRAQKKCEERPLTILKKRIVSDFNQFPNCEITEYGESILKQSRVPILHYIKKVLYVDTPMAIGLDPSSSLPQHWNDMNQVIRDAAHRGYNRSINDILKNKILKGDIVYEKDDFYSVLKYKREDAQEFNLADCATGIKSMALLQLLLKNRFLDENTLLIIDEPEAHLHPQWIIEYARILVLLQKKVNVKLFITSHSTDMVSAIKYISEKEKVQDKVSFYVANEKGKHKYTYSYLENDIEPIFESFNKSFDILQNYVE